MASGGRTWKRSFTLTDAPQITDAHVHFWNPAELNYFWLTPQLERLDRAFLPSDLEPELHASRVSKVVFVQASHDPRENAFALGLAQEHPWIAGVIGWVDLEAATVGASLDRLMQNARFKGARHLVHTEPDPQWLLRPAVQHGLSALEERGLSFDLVLREGQWESALEVARHHPDLTLTLNHLGNPASDAPSLERWQAWLLELAAFPNVNAKCSGLTAHPHLARIAHHAVKAFGLERMMFGSDWPISVTPGAYGQHLETAQGLISADLRAVWTDTAERVYRLAETSTAPIQTAHPSEES
jgi:L-fuconolactonase